MRKLFGPLSCALLLAAALGTASCAGRLNASGAANHAAVKSIQVISVSDGQFAGAVHQLLRDGTPSGPRTSLLAGTVQRQFARALERFEAGDTDQGLSAVSGALLLVRSGELHAEMLDAQAAKALGYASNAVASRGEEGASLAFLHLRAAALPKGSPEQAQVQKHLKAMADWMRDTRQQSEVENQSADAQTYASMAVLEPTDQSLEQARQATERWILSSMAFQANFQPGSVGKGGSISREQAIEAFRGLKAGPFALAALFLRNGDAQSAARALEKLEPLRSLNPDFYRLLDAAAQGHDAAPWRELAELYGRDIPQAPPPQQIGSRELTRGAVWGSLVESLRRDPSSLETALPMSELLVRLRMPEVVPVVLAGAVSKETNPMVMSQVMQLLVAVMNNEDESHNNASVQRIFQAAQPLLATADTVFARSPFEPSANKVRLVMGSIQTKAGELASARQLLEKSLAKDPSMQGYVILASILFQANDTAGALKAVEQALQSPDADKFPLSQADAQILAFQVHRSLGAVEPAKASLGAALRAVKSAQSKASNDNQRASIERQVARLAYYYGDRKAWNESIKRLFGYASSDPDILAMAVLESSSYALLWGDVKVARDAVEQAITANMEAEDLVYAALWLHLNQQQAKSADHEGTAQRAFASIAPDRTWFSQLAQWGLGKINDQTLQSRAQTLVQKSEASFYVAMRKRIQGNAQAQEELTRVAKGPAIDLVETQLARELIVPDKLRTFGPAPSPLP